MKRIILLSILSLSILSVAGLNWEWVASAGTGNLDRVWDIALDNEGNILVTGEFVDTLQIGTTTITGWGLNDIFVAKFSSEGVPLWAKAFGGSEGDIGLSIDTDSLGNSYITGYYGGTAHFEDQDLTSSGSWDVFILKLNPNGDKIWAYSEGGISNDIGYGLAVVPDGRCFIAGWFGDTITFHDNSTITSYGGSDIVTFAIDASGNLLWMHKAGSVGVEYGYKIDVDSQANTYITGTCGQGSNFDGILSPANGAFIASYNPNGNIRWVNSASGAGVNSIAVDRSASLIEQFGCITGRITGTATFDSYTLSSVSGSDDAYGAVFELLTGNWTFADIGGGTGSDKGRACAYKTHPYYTGSYEGSADLFGFNLISSGDSDGFIYCDSGPGNDWMLSEGGSNNDTPTDIAVDNEGNVYICGWYSGIARFGPVLVINSGDASDLDFFIAKINTTTINNDDTDILLVSNMICYPNPFREKLTIEFINSAGSFKTHQDIGIYNNKGQRIRKITASRFEGKNLLTEWNGLNNRGERCPPGVYILKASGSKGKAIKVILMN